MPALNAVAPDFTLHVAKDKKVSLADYRGKAVVLAFFPGAFTGVCTKEACAMRDNEAAWNDVNAKVLGVCVDSVFAIGGWIERNDLTFPIASDHAREAIRAYDVVHENFAGITGYTAAKRSVFVIDAAGLLRWSWVAPNPGVEPDYAEIAKVVGGLGA